MKALNRNVVGAYETVNRDMVLTYTGMVAVAIQVYISSMPNVLTTARKSF